MNLQSTIELVLAIGAVLLLARDLRRAWFDELRRPITLLASAFVAGLLISAVGAPPYPSPYWLTLPAVILVWEVGRGWRRAPRCHLWEAGVSAFAVALLLATVGLGSAGGTVATALVAAATVATAVGAGLLWQSRQREPKPWRPDDLGHYERRMAGRFRG